MIKFIVGVKGSGKTKQMLDLANSAGKSSKGDVVYIDRDKRHIYDLDRSVRLIETNDFHMQNLKSFYGFICGIISQNFDVEMIFIDGQKIVTEAGDQCLEDFVNNLKILNEKFNVDFVVSMSRSKESLPEFVYEFIQ